MATEGLAWMLPPLAMCLVLGGIHGYLGLHVLSRKVIFVDLALAQIAALGAAIAVLIGYDVEHAPRAVYFISLGFTILGAALFAWTRLRRQTVPQEALIGLSYATASAITLLILAKSPGESEHLKSMLAGNILLVTWPTVASTAAIYAVIGAFHLAFRKPFLEISHDARGALAAGRRVRLWDFLFYATFGVVITSSVAVAGVLLVFSFLVAPAIIAFFFSARLGSRLVIAWLVALVASFGGILISYYADLPTAPSVVVSLAGLLLVASAARAVLSAQSRARALITLGAALVAGGLVVHGVKRVLLGDAAGSEPGAAPGAGAAPELDAARLGQELLSPEAGEPHEMIVSRLAALGAAARPALPSLIAAAQQSDDPFLRVELVKVLLALEPREGLRAASALMESEPPPLAATDLDDALEKRTGQRFGLGGGDSDAANQAARQRLRAYAEAPQPTP